MCAPFDPARRSPVSVRLSPEEVDLRNLLRYEAQNRKITLPKGDVISWATSPKNHEIAIQNGCKRYEATDPAGNASPSIEKAQ